MRLEVDKNNKKILVSKPEERVCCSCGNTDRKHYYLDEDNNKLVCSICLYNGLYKSAQLQIEKIFWHIDKFEDE